MTWVTALIPQKGADTYEGVRLQASDSRAEAFRDLAQWLERDDLDPETATEEEVTAAMNDAVENSEVLLWKLQEQPGDQTLFSKQVIGELERYFPWLTNPDEQDVSGADTIETLGEWHAIEQAIAATTEPKVRKPFAEWRLTRAETAACELRRIALYLQSSQFPRLAAEVRSAIKSADSAIRNAKLITVMMDPEKFGRMVCPQCNGYGSSLKEPAPTCTRCGGDGLVPKLETQK